MTRFLYMAQFCCFVAVVAVFGASACGKRPDDALLLKAWNHCEALEYNSAFPLVREYLLAHPRNPVAHYLFGKCHQQREKPSLTIAKGQYDMARYLFDLEGDMSILADIMTPSDFQATLHCDTALALLRTVVEAEEAGMPQKTSIPVLRLARDHARKAAYFSPTSFFIRDLAQTLDTMLDRIAPPDTPQHEPPVLPPPGRWTT
ncbi:MAG TPA: hypothetical protein ENN29_04140 [Candidatus Hydrogenedentes bacterium]|nr:hypothetical protein [Candidatus Hydrogenedentota bacterium]